MNQPELTPDQKEDIQKRSEEFMKRYEELSNELQIDWASKPMLVSIGPGLYGITMYAGTQDKKYLAVPSPITPEEPLIS